MDLQSWDNVVSIISNTVTAVSVAGGVIFGKRKVDEWLSQKNRDRAHDSTMQYINALDGFLSSVIQLAYYTMNYQELNSGNTAPDRIQKTIKVHEEVNNKFSELKNAYNSLKFWGIGLTEEAQIEYVLLHENFLKLATYFTKQHMLSINLRLENSAPSIMQHVKNIRTQIEGLKARGFSDTFVFSEKK